MDEINDKQLRKGGRNPKKDPAVFRYSISLSAEENARFLSLFEQSGMNVMAHFITACIFQKTIKTVKIDKAAMDYYMRLTTLYGQFRASSRRKKRQLISTNSKSKRLKWQHYARRLSSSPRNLKQNI
jgi:hypothetical protein